MRTAVRDDRWMLQIRINRDSGQFTLFEEVDANANNDCEGLDAESFHLLHSVSCTDRIRLSDHDLKHLPDHALQHP